MRVLTKILLKDKQLIELQKISFYDPFLEDENFTNQWEQMKENYKNETLDKESRKNFLKYDVYTEMLFNFIRMSLDTFKSEKELLKYVDFKDWVRTHSTCWQKPLKEHSNREVYLFLFRNFRTNCIFHCILYILSALPC